jgi:hypothetical protein
MALFPRSLRCVISVCFLRYLLPGGGSELMPACDANRTVSFGCAPNAVALDPDQGPACHSGPE